VSHVSGDDDAYVHEFFHDLCRKVAELAGAARAQDVGVLASTLGPGAEAWPGSAAAGLAGGHVFVPLCSPRLFLSESAGRHWWIFRERLQRARDGAGDAPSMLPVRWASVGDLPSGFPDFVPVDAADPRRPLRQFLRLKSHRPQYREFLHRLADRIVRTARAHPLPGYWPLPAPSRTPNAFAAGAAGLGGPLTRGTRNVRFVVAAGSREDMERIRAGLESYGKGSAEWAPYRPLSAGSLADQAQAVAAGRLFGSEVTDLKDLQRTLDLAREAKDLVVLLLDPWSTRLPESRRQLSDADRAGLPDAAVLVPLNAADPESQQSREELMFEVEQTLSQFLGRSDALYSGRLPTPDSFGSELAAALEEGRNRMFRAGRKPSGGAARERPILCGP
jgi:FxsC-like protein